MLTLLRQVRAGPNGLPEYTDKEVSGSRLSLGSDAAADIQLLGSGILPEHAVVSVSARHARLRCKRGARVFVDDKPVRSVALKPGAEIVIAGNRLVVLTAPSGFGLALELRFGEGYQAGDFERVFRTRLDQTWLQRRPVSWFAVCLLLLALLVIPLYLAQQRSAGRPPPAALPTDLLWSSGPLTPAHQQAIGNNCGACHQKLFVPVQDSACSNCHQQVHDHVTPAHLQLTRFAQRKPSCESCHREHQQPVSAIIVKDSALCVDCHGTDRANFGRLDIQTVSGFHSGSHPDFKVHLLQPVPGDPAAGTRDAQWQFVATALAGAAEHSNLSFSHKQHLDPARVSKNGSDGGLNCADCHVMNADGRRFRPITMRDSCISCHDLTFDPLEPMRQLPHGKPREVIATIEEFYARRYLEPEAVATPQVKRRQLPDSEDKIEIRCTDSASSCAQQMAAKMIQSQFAVRGCRSCHQIKDTGSADINERYQVLAVKLGNEFYPHAVFKHSSHLIQGDLTGDAACKSCHAADRSENSSQVLMPGIQKCLGCHSDSPRDTQRQVDAHEGSPASNRREVVALSCVGCHVYHPEESSNPSDDALTALR